ncbi:MAG: flippase-like domain-containing protein [Gammaproteobacteria bacterium]|nr:MAG: flippase-like domain-containing protein [Gammaproteobacteria bacterium]
MYGLTVRMALVLKSKIAKNLMWLLALALTGWTLVHLPLASIRNSVLSLAWQQWFAWLGVNLIIIFLSAKRWHSLITMLKETVSFKDVLFMRQAGNTINFITPGPQFGGEPLQVYWLCRSGASLEKALLSIGLDRGYEVLVNFTVLALCLFFLVCTGDVPFIKASSITASNIFVGVFYAVAVSTVFLATLRWLIGRSQRISVHLQRFFSGWNEHRFIKKIQESWRSMKGDLGAVLRTQKLTLTNAALISFLAWGGLLVELALLLQFLNIDFDAPAFLLILISMRLALLLPIPGGVGTLEASVFWSFHYLHLPDAAAIGLIALMRLRDIIILLFGFYCLRSVNKKSASPETASSY